MNIVIISAARSGSGWLLRSLDTEYVINTDEIFNKGLSGQIKIKQEDLDILYSSVTDQKIWVKKLAYKSISYLDMKQIQDKIASNKKDCLYKILYEHYLYNPIEINETINNSDLIIGLYRYNILESYISLVKAANTKVWWSSTDNTKNIDKNAIKIKWSLANYVDFYLQRIKGINWIKSYNHKNCVLFSYEEIHSEMNNTDQKKVDYVKTKILNQTGHDLIFNSNYDIFFKKENTLKNISENFINPTSFLRDYSKIPQTYS